MSKNTPPWYSNPRVCKAPDLKLKVTGDLTLHGVTKEVVLNVDGPSAPVKDARGNLHMGASASTVINRSDFGMTGYQAMVGNEININIDVEVVQPAQAQTASK